MGYHKSSIRREVYRNTTYIKKLKRHQINDLTMNFKDLDKQEEINPKLEGESIKFENK